ncbi:venom dipeptidyl peptidase 4 [Vespa crabro]|uniref:venom dipeptidyl peptidase 4 n=1 Tax=Vespa crabro TaxID=7445 RepID=UPI001F01CE30|nr:venom dipeptidyl peptidase 4 [Vespa crabro]XP_046814898.1 venom dipeptidyl peptidase 4 [Vespa crabro]
MVPLRSFVLLNGLFFVLLAARTVVTRVIDKDNLDGILETQDGQNLSKEPFNLEETYTADFLAYTFNGTWTSDTTIVYTDTMTGDILQFDVIKQRLTVIVDSSVMDDYLVSHYALSPKGRFLLIGYDLQKGFRHSKFMRYVIYDIELGGYDKIANGMHIALAKWAPLTDDLIYILDNDIYYMRFSNNGFNDVQRVTYDGIVGIVYNGVPDWVYEEEVFHGSSAIWYSPDGSHLAYASFDDRNVQEILYLHYGEPGNLVDQYPTEVKIKYPKAGTSNPVVSLTLVDLHDPTLNKIDLKAPIEVVGTDNVLSNVQWKDFDHVIAMWSNRVQNKTEIVWYNKYGEIVKTLDVEEHEGWVEIKNLFFYKDFFYMRKLQPSGTKAGRFHHVIRYDDTLRSSSIQMDLTPGITEVQDIRAIDHSHGRIYYLATGPGEPSQRNLYSVPADGSEKPTCISCNVLTPEGNACTYADAIFSPFGQHYVLICQGPDPMIVGIFDNNHKKVYSWENNLSLRSKLARRELPLVKDLYVRANGYESKVRLFLPHNFDESKSYPMLVNVYAGPNTAKIIDVASYGYHAYMTTNRSVIYAYIDGRGSSNKGSKMLFEIYRKLGTVEVEDQISVTRKLQEMFPWIDSKRTGVWGWSYGGFCSAMILAKDLTSVFKCGIAVAPVSSWIYYDSIYTERYMGLPTPEDNLGGYNGTDVSRRVEDIRGKKFMLIHGSGDDNVHYQQSLALAKALEKADIMFEQITYTDEAHALFGVLPHLYHTMDRFWSDCFSLSHAH